MPAPTYTVKVRALGSVGAFTTLTDVQNINVSVGRQRQLDAYQASRATVVLRYPSGYASPISALAAGSTIEIINSSSFSVLFKGRISNVTVQYGIPYASSVGVADYVQINCEGTLAALGRMSGEGYSMGADTIGNQLSDASTETNLTLQYRGSGGGPSLDQTDVDGTWGDWLTKALQSINGRMYDAWETDYLYVIDPNYKYVSTINFSDAANNATNQVYDQIDFHGLADNFYTQVTIDPEKHTSATSTKAGATKPYRTLLMNTFSSSVGAAQDFADFLLGYYQEPTVGIASVSCLAEAQNSFKLDEMGMSKSLGLEDMPSTVGVQVGVTFRGTTFTCIVEGVEVNAQPGSARFTYHLSSADLNAYLILDNATFGKLDENKLGYI